MAESNLYANVSAVPEDAELEDMDMDTEDSDVFDSLNTLESQIRALCETSNFLSHRLDTIQRLLDQETFELETQPITLYPGQHIDSVKRLLDALELTDTNLKLGDFLRALNRYLIHNDLVDLNDLQIRLSPLIASAFQKAPGLKKIPYPLLLTALPKMFR
jgi:hypothetical protein